MPSSLIAFSTTVVLISPRRGELIQGGDRDALGIDLEEAPQRGSVFAAAKAVGAQRRQARPAPSAGSSPAFAFM